LLSEQNQSQKSLAELREHRSAQIARRAVLEDLEDRQEGFGIGVREILRRADEADTEPWNLICGSVADLLDVDMENAALLEVALSGRAQLLVVTRLKPLIDYLNSGRCRITDRVGFISIENTEEATRDLSELRGSLRRDDESIWAAADSDAETTQQENSWWGRKKTGRAESDSIERMLAAAGSAESLQVTWVDPRTESAVVRSVFSQGDTAPPLLFGQRGVVGRADGLARPPQSMPGLASHLLADTWVVETLADALRLHAITHGQCRFVTLQGELIEGDGTLFAGTVRNESALLSRKSELRRLRNELHRLEHEIAQRELLLRSLGQNISSTDERLNQTRKLVNECSSRCRKAENQLAEHRRQRKELQRQSDILTAQSQKLSDEISGLLSQTDDAEQLSQSGEVLLQQQQQLIAELTTQLAERQQELEGIERDRTAASLELTRSEERLLGLQEAVERVREDLEQRHLQQQEADRRLTSAAERQRDLLIARLNASAEIAELSVADEQLATEIHLRGSARNRLRTNKNAVTADESQIRDVLRQHETRHHEVELQVRGIDHQLTTTAERIREEFQMEVREAVASGRSAVAIWLQKQTSEGGDSEGDGESESSAKSASIAIPVATMFDAAAAAVIADNAQYTEMRTEIDRRVERLRRQLKKIGNVGTESLDNLIELETRFQRLHMQLTDLESARDTLRDIVRRINIESKRMFLESFETIRGYFRELFRKLFGGGEADLILEDPEDVLECSIDVVARPPGKELRSISLLSGGERTLTAVALLLSIFKSRTSPFCILDEVDAALDDANIGRFVNVLREFQQNTQFIMITHRKPTMAVTDVLYGVTMEESGISRRLSLRFEDVDEHGNFIAAAKKSKAA
jgi:chromosome segregation protein